MDLQAIKNDNFLALGGLVIGASTGQRRFAARSAYLISEIFRGYCLEFQHPFSVRRYSYVRTSAARFHPACMKKKGRGAHICSDKRITREQEEQHDLR